MARFLLSTKHGTRGQGREPVGADGSGPAAGPSRPTGTGEGNSERGLVGVKPWGVGLPQGEARCLLPATTAHSLAVF